MHGARGIKNAVEAGVDSIEHGSLIDDDGIELMKKHGTYLVADIYNDDFILGKAKELNTLKEYVDKEAHWVKPSARTSPRRSKRASRSRSAPTRGFIRTATTANSFITW